MKEEKKKKNKEDEKKRHKLSRSNCCSSCTGEVFCYLPERKGSIAARAEDASRASTSIPAGQMFRQASDFPQPSNTCLRYRFARSFFSAPEVWDSSRESAMAEAVPVKNPPGLKLGQTSRQQPHCRHRAASYARSPERAR